MKFKIYYKLKLSILDAGIPEDWIKIGINKHSKDLRNKVESISINLCSLGGCNSSYKPCQNYKQCPYLIIRKKSRPRANSREFADYEKELNLQMTQCHLQVIRDEKIERYLNGELLPHEYTPLVNLIADNIKKYQVDNVYYDKIFSDVKKELLTREHNNTKILKDTKRVIYDIGDYYFIDIDNLPNYRVGDESVWYQINSSGGWVLKERFDAMMWEIIKMNLLSVNNWNRAVYTNAIKQLEVQIEEFYGLLTMWKLIS